MVTDIHCHFIPEELFKFVRARDDFALKLKVLDGERIDIDVRGMHCGLTPTSFAPGRQCERRTPLSISRTLICLPTPPMNSPRATTLGLEAARLCKAAS